MNNYDKLIEKLKENNEIKKDLEELRFGCKVIIKCCEKGKNQNGGSELIKKGYSSGYMTSDKDYAHINGFKIICVEKDELDNNSMSFDMTRYGEKFYGISKIIGNPLEQRHLMMYFSEKQIYICITTNGFMSDAIIDNPFTRIDNTKPFHLQDDKVYGEILEYLNNN